jgi:hypothetical protein
MVKSLSLRRSSNVSVRYMFSNSSRCISSLVNLRMWLDKTEITVTRNLLHKVQHDGLGNHIDHGALDNVVVGRNEQLCETVSNMQLNHVISSRRTDNLDFDVLAL